MKTRYYPIDFLKAVSILVIIVLHYLSYSLSDKFIFNLWNWLHFVVTAFVFASGYLFADQVNAKKFFHPLAYLKKRLLRLILPYYYFLALRYALMFFAPFWFSGIGLQKTFGFFINSVFLLNGVDYSWFVLLFIQITLLSWLIGFFINRKVFLWLLMLISILISVWFYLFKFPYNHYKWVMAFSWLWVYLLGYFTALYTNREFKSLKARVLYLSLAGFFAVLFFSAGYVRGYFDVLTSNKYPPNIYYLSYGLSWALVLIFAGSFLTSRVFKKVTAYLSAKSYELFFSHYLVLDFFVSNQGWLNFGHTINLLMILGLSLLVIIVFQLSFAKLKS